MSDAMKPGATALHVMLRALYSRATDLVSPITPAWATHSKGAQRQRGSVSVQRRACPGRALADA